MGENQDALLPGDRGWAPGAFTELRIHGVGNTALDRVLDDHDPRQVAGDEVVGFYRSRSTKQLELGTPDQPQKATTSTEDNDASAEPGGEAALHWTDVEAYDWGGFNTGGGWRALWILLLPFTLANLAGWMVAGRNSMVQRWVKLAGFGVTILFVVSIGALTIDLVALQCGWQEACVERQIFLKPFGWGTWMHDPAHRMALALVVPMAVTGVLWYWPGRRSHHKYETFSDQNRVGEQLNKDTPSIIDPNDETGGDHGHSKKSWLPNARIWTRTGEVPVEALFHVAGILAVLCAGVSYAHWNVKGHWLDLVMAVAGSIISIAVAIWVFSWSPFANAETPPRTEKRRRWSRAVFLLSIVLTGLVIIAAFALDRGYSDVDWSTVAVPLSEGVTQPDTNQTTLGNETNMALRATIELAAVETNDLSNSLRWAYMTLTGAILVPTFLALLIAAFRTPDVNRKRNRRLWGRFAPVVALATGLAIAAVLVTGAGLWLEELLGDRPAEHFEALGVEMPWCGIETGDPSTRFIPRSAVPAACDHLPDNPSTNTLAARTRFLEQLTSDTHFVAELPLLSYMSWSVKSDIAVLSEPVIAVNWVYDVVAVSFLVLVVIVVVLIGGSEIWLRCRRIPFWTYPVRCELRSLLNEKLLLRRRSLSEVKKWRKAGVSKLRKSPRFTRMHRVASPIAVSALGVGFLILLVVLVDWTPTALLERLGGVDAWPFTAARWLITALVVAVAGLVARSYSPEAQESFGGIWDVLTFWPRHYHPFAVPSYGERAVLELSQRIELLTRTDQDEDQRRTCLLSAHSGGVVITLAAVSLLESDTRDRISLLTYGSPTGSLYGRAFPEYFDADCLIPIANGLATDGDSATRRVRWLNLWRLTDWTGGYSFGPQSDRFMNPDQPDERSISGTGATVSDVEKLQFDPALDTLRDVQPYNPMPEATGHTDYLHDPKHVGAEDPRYQSARGELLALLQGTAQQRNT